jgi:hypothetical protein
VTVNCWIFWVINMKALAVHLPIFFPYAEKKALRRRIRVELTCPSE